MPRYTPWTKARYEVSPGLKLLGWDFGNGEWDGKVFQFGPDAQNLLDAKQESLAERRSKYRQSYDLSPKVAKAACSEIISRLRVEWPDVSLPEHDDPFVLLDLLADRVPEDIALVATDGATDWLAYGSICVPSHWALEEKIGRSFAAMHQPVPGFHRTAAVADRMIDAMVRKGPWVRFVWSLESDNRPNHHPKAPRGVDQAEWWGREFSRKNELWVRVERQCLVPLTAVGAALFTIRLSWLSVAEVVADESLRVPLLQAVVKMTPEERAYKGIDAEILAICRLLDTGSIVGDEPKAVVAWIDEESSIGEQALSTSVVSSTA